MAFLGINYQKGNLERIDLLIHTEKAGGNIRDIVKKETPYHNKLNLGKYVIGATLVKNQNTNDPQSEPTHNL